MDVGEVPSSAFRQLEARVMDLAVTFFSEDVLVAKKKAAKKASKKAGKKGAKKAGKKKGGKRKKAAKKK